MLYSEDLESARAVSDRALQMMAELSIPANPMNFTLWYTHAAGRHPDLSKAIELAKDSGLPFTPDRSEALFEKFFGMSEESEAVVETGAAVSKKIATVVDILQSAGSDNGDFSAKLETISKDLIEGTGAVELAEVVRDLLLETHDTIDRAKALETRLQDSAKEIEALREHLQVVRLEALTDALTGIANRKCFDIRLQEEAAKAMESDQPLCLVIADIDHFKVFNDSFGHRVGDSVLKVVARNLRSAVKDRETPARYGGEEFCLILPETNLDSAAALAEQIRAKLAKKELKNTKTDQSYGSVTLSFGIGKYCPGEPLSELIQRADRALYRAKDAGRNQVISEDQLSGGLSLAG